MMLISVSRLLIVSSFNLLFCLLLAHILRIFVLETVKALSVLGKGDLLSIFTLVLVEFFILVLVEFVLGRILERTPIFCFYIFFPPMRARSSHYGITMHRPGARDKVRKLCSVNPILHRGC